MSMVGRPLGATGLFVSAVGLGAGRVGGDDSSDAEVDRLVGRALELGVNLIDSARSYGRSEERLGRALAGRRDQVVLSTKLGYGVPGVPDWTAASVLLGVDAALVRLATDRLEIVHLHSCDRPTLESSGVVEALATAVRAGKVRVAAYSGEGEALRWAQRCGAFGVLQCSVSPVDQAGIGGVLDDAAGRGIGVLAKRALGNAPWRFAARPPEDDVAEAWQRFAALELDAAGLPWEEVFSRFAAWTPGVSAILVGTASAAHLEEAVAAVARGPLAEEHVRSLREAWRRHGESWTGRI